MSPLPVTSTFALPLTLYYLLLQARVVAARVATKTYLSPTANASTTTTTINSETPKTPISETADPLLPTFRAQANFAENVPIVLILAGLAEANGGDKTVVASALAVVTVGRVLHADFGLMRKGARGLGRQIGFFSTVGPMLGLAGYAAWTARGYWGV